MHSLICLSCSNGCRLSVTRKDAATLLVLGNYCPKGIAFAFEQLKDKEPGKFISSKKILPYSYDFLLSVLHLWGKKLTRVFPGIFIQGSPERSLFRTVIEDENNNRYILEEIASHSVERKKTIAVNLQLFAQADLPIIPLLKGLDNQYIQIFENHYWLLSNYIPNTPLDRTSYWKESWRGKALAEFLTRFYALTKDFTESHDRFSLQNFIKNLLQTIEKRDPVLFNNIASVRSFLNDRFFPVVNRIPYGFCHGDPHPLNMLWGKNNILAVIDWEFCGYKPVLYDAALIIGCVGAEHKQARNREMITTFIKTLEKNHVFPENTFEYLDVFVLAQRFGWLSEWLRRKDTQMINFEVKYMQFLIDGITCVNQ